jgi:hypothetical protein
MALMFQKLRGVLQRAMADQASSLKDALGHQRGNRETAPMMTAAAMAKWDTCAINLRLSATPRCLLLTLSHLLGWIYWLKGYLSFVLSVHLGGGDAATPPIPRSSTGINIINSRCNCDYPHPCGDDSRKDAYQPTHHVLLACLLRPVRAPQRRQCRDPPSPQASTGIDFIIGSCNRDCCHPCQDDSWEDACQPTHYVLLE